MKAKDTHTLTPEELQELFDRPDQTSTVRQEMLREYVEIEEQIRLARFDLEAVGAEIAELLVTGTPVQSGVLTACLLSGRLVVCCKDGEAEEAQISDHDLPF
jgi:hypothetical protein